MEMEKALKTFMYLVILSDNNIKNPCVFTHKKNIFINETAFSKQSLNEKSGVVKLIYKSL